MTTVAQTIELHSRFVAEFKVMDGKYAVAIYDHWTCEYINQIFPTREAAERAYLQIIHTIFEGGAPSFEERKVLLKEAI